MLRMYDLCVRSVESKFVARAHSTPPVWAVCEMPRLGSRLRLELAPMERLMAAVRLGASLKRSRFVEAVVRAATYRLASDVAALPCQGSRTPGGGSALSGG